MSMPTVTVEHHKEWHLFMDKCSNSQAVRIVKDATRCDPNALRFFQAVSNSLPLGFCASYFMLDLAAGSLPVLEASTKARVIQDFAQLEQRDEIVKRIGKENSVLLGHIHETTLGNMGAFKDKDPEALKKNAVQKIREHDFTYEMIRQQLNGKTPQLDLNSLSKSPVKLEYLPTASEEQYKHMKGLSDRIAGTGETELISGVIERNDPDLLSFFQGALQSSGTTLNLAYAFRTHVVDGRLPVISDEVKVEVLQDYGPVDVKSRARARVDAMRKILETDRHHADFIAITGHNLADLLGKKEKISSMDEDVLLYLMLERQIEKDNE